MLSVEKLVDTCKDLQEEAVDGRGVVAGRRSANKSASAGLGKF